MSCAELPGAMNQRVYPGAGDIDDCWVVATCWAAKASDPSIRLVSVPTFRYFAGDPDDGDTDGGSLTEVVAGSRGSWPDLPVRELRAPWAAAMAELETGHILSLAVLSGRLPLSYRYGFTGWHQLGVAWCDGTLVIMNPLQPNGTRPRAIAPNELAYAATALGNIRAAVYPPTIDAEDGYAMKLDDPTALTGTARMIASWRLWRVVDDTATAAVPAGTTFDVLGSARYHKSDATPDGYLGYLVEHAGELHVLPSDRVSTFSAAWTTLEAWNRGVAEAAKRAATAARTD